MANIGQELLVAIAALAVAVPAFFAAIMQIIQTYIAAGRRVPACDERVMGAWSKGTKIRPRWSPLHLEVTFGAPIIFLAPPPGKPSRPEPGDMWNIEGTMGSFERNRLINHHPGFGDGFPRISKRIHTVDDEMATWVYLLGALEKMEHDSKQWELETYREDGLPRTIQPNLPEPTLAIKVQAKRRSFEVASTIRRPYATTTLSHMVELAARIFDRMRVHCRAEGNGFIFTGSCLENFGLVFAFEQTGRIQFGKRRLIPTSEAKELCFGSVPTLYRTKHDPDEDADWPSPLKAASGTFLKVEILQLGSRAAFIETFTHIGCNDHTALLVLHMNGRHFRFLPNPTIFSWDSDSFSLLRLLEAFRGLLIRNMNILDAEDLVILDVAFCNIRKASVRYVTELHRALDLANGFLLSADQEVVPDVLRRHLQRVMDACNYPRTAEVNTNIFSGLLGIPPELREQRLMEKYFHSILWSVVPVNSTHGANPDEEAISRAIHAAVDRRHDAQSMESGQSQPRDDCGSPLPTESDMGPPSLANQDVSFSGPEDGRLWNYIADDRHEMQRLTIWLTLVFRMICWLTLHDFEKKTRPNPRC
ncbi:hypothetical protein LZ30DRAFT_754947 [Colletotrichum cereale]|nr:hypothetical protein LZ30DRAFT_754947 [Colletotrichum cereale]